MAAPAFNIGVFSTAPALTTAPVMLTAPSAVRLMTGAVRLIEPGVMLTVLIPTLRVMDRSAVVEIAIATVVV